MKKTLVIGASENPTRYSWLAVQMLQQYGHPIEAIGARVGVALGVPIQTGLPELVDIDTVTLYVGPQNQPPFISYILGLQPKRVIFNPGTENPEFENTLRQNNIEPIEACTLVMLRTNQY